MSETTRQDWLTLRTAPLLPNLDAKAHAEDWAVAALGTVPPERRASIAGMYASLGVPSDEDGEMVILPDETWAFVFDYICLEIIDDGPEIV